MMERIDGKKFLQFGGLDQKFSVEIEVIDQRQEGVYGHSSASKDAQAIHHTFQIKFIFSKSEET